MGLIASVTAVLAQLATMKQGDRRRHGGRFSENRRLCSVKGKHRWGACAERLPRALRALAMTQRGVPCSPFPVPWCLVGAGYLWRSMIAATERVCSLFPVPCSLVLEIATGPAGPHNDIRRTAAV